MNDPKKMEKYTDESLKNPEIIRCQNLDPLARKSRHKNRGAQKKRTTQLNSRKTHQESANKIFFRPQKLGF